MFKVLGGTGSDCTGVTRMSQLVMSALPLMPAPHPTYLDFGRAVVVAEERPHRVAHGGRVEKQKRIAVGDVGGGHISNSGFWQPDLKSVRGVNFPVVIRSKILPL